MSFSGNFNTQLPYVQGSYSPSRGGYNGTWQGAISQCSHQTGLSATQCAHTLSPQYDGSRKSRSRSSSYGGNYNGSFNPSWQQQVSQVAHQYGVNAIQAAHMLSPHQHVPLANLPYYGQTQTRSRSRSPSPSRTVGNLNLSSYQGPLGGQSYRAGTTAMIGEPILNEYQATTMSAVQASGSPRHITRSGSSENRSNLSSDELRRVAQALGVSTQGGSKTIAQAVRHRVGGMSPRTQQSFVGGLSPRSLGTVNGLFY